MSASRTFRRRMRRAAFVLPAIPDAASVAAKNALAIRNAATTTGQCPACGATVRLVQGTLEPGTVSIARIEHEHTCPVVSEGAP